MNKVQKPSQSKYLFISLQKQYEEICTQQLVCTVMQLCQEGQNMLLRQDVQKQSFALPSFRP